MSEFLSQLERAFRQYVVPCLTGTAFALVVLLGVLLFFACYYAACRPRRGSLEWVALGERRGLSFRLPLHPMVKRDALPLLLLTAVYAATAFFRLGSTVSPQSALDLGDGAAVEVRLDHTLYLTRLGYFSGLGTGGYNVEISADGRTWYTLWSRKDDDGKVTGYYWADAADLPPSYALPQGYNDLFKWLEIEPENPQNVRYLRLTGRADKQLLELGELALYDQHGALAATGAAGPLFDEQGAVPDRPTWFNSAYFDEIYHARTALEHIEGVYPYEVSHPPLGKLLIGLGIRAFGMTPFGWRFVGTLFGVGMVPLLYLFLKNLFGKTAVATCGAALFAFDFMHLTQTRIATIDTYGVFFILLMYYFMYRYLALPAGAPFRKCAPPLLLSGLFWGVGAASKWTVIYAAVGLAIVYFIGLFFKLRAWPAEIPGKLPWLWKILGFSVLCFVVLPLLIYALSYLPYAQAKGEVSLKGLLDVCLENQKFMFTYHEGVTATHPYSSRWYQWLVDGRPILYYLDNKSGAAEGLKAAFGCFSNPVVCWAGLLAMLTVSAQAFRRRRSRVVFFAALGAAVFGACLGVDRIPWWYLVLPALVYGAVAAALCLADLFPDCTGRAPFLLIGYLSQLVPWMFIGRTTFAYHYFPSTLFLAMAVAYVMDGLIERRPKNWRIPVYGLTAGCVGLYALFYPVLTGLMVPTWYTSTLLRWFYSWPF